MALQFVFQNILSHRRIFRFGFIRDLFGTVSYLDSHKDTDMENVKCKSVARLVTLIVIRLRNCHD